MRNIIGKFKKRPLIIGILIFWIISTALFIYFNYPLIAQNFNYYFGEKKNQEATITNNTNNNQSTEEKIYDIPNKIVIEKINVDAPIVEASGTKDKDILEALKSGVVHYPTTSLPGETGNVFITGHSSNYRWAKGNYNYVFSILNKVQNDDIIVVYWNKKRYVYKVFDIKVVSPKDVSVLDQTEESIISLMTCDPPGTTWKRRVVKGLQIEPDPKKNKPWQSRLNTQDSVDNLVGN